MRSADYDVWHLPVLVDAVIEYLSIKPGGLYVDLTYADKTKTRSRFVAIFCLELVKANGKILIGTDVHFGGGGEEFLVRGTEDISASISIFE
jgi:hypothetical protein